MTPLTIWMDRHPKKAMPLPCLYQPTDDRHQLQGAPVELVQELALELVAASVLIQN